MGYKQQRREVEEHAKAMGQMRGIVNALGDTLLRVDEHVDNAGVLSFGLGHKVKAEIQASVDWYRDLKAILKAKEEPDAKA